MLNQPSRNRHRFGRRHRRGAMMIMIVVMMIGFMVAVALTVDIANMHLARTELRTATDAASKAAAAALADTTDIGDAVQQGRRIAAQNRVNGKPLQLSRQDFVFGRSRQDASGKFQFTTSGFPRNSVQVTGRKTKGSLSGAVPLFFGNLMGVEYFEPTVNATATYIERDVVLVVDRSGSMRGQKFRDLISAIDIFVDTLQSTPVDERVGMASYNHFSSEDVPLTADLSLISSGVRRLRVRGMTSISRGMDSGQNIMNGSRNANFVERTMIVMTDGKHNRGPEPRISAQSLANNGIQIHTITFGSGADLARMREVARIGHGRHFHANDGDQLRQIYRDIALTLSTIMTE